MADVKKYRVFKGIFEGTVFEGELLEKTENERQRILDVKSIGVSFFADFCEEISNTDLDSKTFNEIAE